MKIGFLSFKFVGSTEIKFIILIQSGSRSPVIKEASFLNTDILRNLQEVEGVICNILLFSDHLFLYFSL